MKNIWKYIMPGTAMAILAVSCTEFEDIPARREVAGMPVEVRAILGTPAIKVSGEAETGANAAATRAAPAGMSGDRIHDVWVFQFDGTGDYARLVVSPYYIANEVIAAAGDGPVTMRLIASEGARHLLLFAANVPGGEEYNWGVSATKGSRSTLKEVRERYLRLPNEEAAYGGTNGAVIMSGTAVTEIAADIVVDGDSDPATADGPGVALTRSLAKVELTLSIDGAEAPGYKVISVRMRNVSRHIDIFDGVLAERGGFPVLYPADDKMDKFDYAAVYNADGSPLLEEGGAPRTFVWYVPRNMRGANPASISKYTRNGMAPFDATYFEIVATDGTGGIAVYRIYPGANETNDFNVVSNRRYHFNLAIAGDGGDTPVDTRIEDYGPVMFDGANNSFIVNPPYEGMPARSFSVPVARVNEYWGSSLPGFGNSPANVIGDTDSWQVYLLWQDAPDIVRPAAAADATANITITKNTGSGTASGGDGYFTVTVPHGVRHGNFVVALRKGLETPTNPILWSWHFWVTDYAPRPPKAAVKKDQFVYPCEGGQVERYVAKRFGYSSDDSRAWSMIEWNPSPTPSASLAGSVVMDRHIGALVGGVWSGDLRANGLYYQFGRKDPFPAAISLYNIDGTAIARAPASFPGQSWSGTNPSVSGVDNGANGIYRSVTEPMMYLVKSDGNWSQLAGNGEYGWHDPRSDKTDYLTKSIYDPCPAGWRMMPIDAWRDFTYGITVPGYNMGARYYPCTGEDGMYSGGGAYYPAIWHRSGINSRMQDYGGTHAASHSATTQTDILVYSLQISDKSINNRSTGSQSLALPVRCASDDRLP